MLWLKQSTAVTIKLGPFVDETDGYTAETGLTLSQADVRLSKNGGNMAQKNESSAATHDEIGYYDCPLDTTDTNTLGRLLVMVHESGARPVRLEFLIVPANTYDSLIAGSDLLLVDDDVIADQVWDEAMADHQGGGITGAYLISAQVNSVDILADTNELQTDLTNGGRLDLILDAILAASGSGSGAVTFTYTLTSSVDASPIPDARVWATSDAGGSTVLASGSTDANGQITFYLDAGTVYFWRQKAGWDFSNPDTETVS